MPNLSNGVRNGAQIEFETERQIEFETERQIQFETGRQIELKRAFVETPLLLEFSIFVAITAAARGVPSDPSRRRRP